MTQAHGNPLFSHLRRTLRAGALTSARDEELLEQFVAQRDEAAFAILLRRHGPMVWGVCQRLLAHRQDAEDAFQATFLVLACKAASIGKRHLLANWLFGVARRSALSVRSGKARRARLERLCGDLPDVPATPKPLWDDLWAVLDEELARMPDKYRLPLLLCGLEGMTHAEAGKSLGWPTGTVAGRLSRARELLRIHLLRRGIAAPAVAVAALLTPTALAGPPPLVIAAVRKAAPVTMSKWAAAGVSPAVTTLMQGVLRKMVISRLAAASALVAALVLVLTGAGAIYLRIRPAETSTLALAGPERLPSGVAANPELPEQAGFAAVPGIPGKPALRLPADPNAVVFRMERSVDFAPGPGMVLTIYANGRVVAEAPEGLFSLSATDLTEHVRRGGNTQDANGNPPPRESQVFEGKLSAGEIKELLRFALHEQEFFDFDPAAVQAAIRAKNPSLRNVTDPTDATTTSFRIQTADRNHEVRWSRLDKAAWDFPEEERLLQLHAVDQRLQQVFYVLVAGGPERVETAVAQMSKLVEYYYRRYPDLPRLTVTDLFRVTPSADGSWTRFSFSRNKDKLVRHPLFEVTIEVPRQGEPRLVYVMPPNAPVAR